MRPSLVSAAGAAARVASCLAIASILAPVARADRIVTKTGRTVEGKLRDSAGKLPSSPLDPKGVYTLQLPSGKLSIPGDHIASFAVEGDMSDYEPKDDREREMLAKGFVFYGGQWLSKDRYQQDLARKSAEAKARLEEVRRRSEWGNAWEKETAHFQFKANSTKEVLDDFAALLEEYYKVFEKRFGLRPSPVLKRTKMTVNFYKSEDEYIETGGAPRGTAGYFSRQDESLNFYYDPADPLYTRQVMLHEGTHLLTYLMNPQFYPPTWINEAVAEYFSAAKIEGPEGKRRIIPGQVLDGRLLLVQQAIDDGKPMPLERILDQDQSGFGAEFYAYAWTFVHFLFSTPKYGKKFEKFFLDVYNGRGVKADHYSGPDKSGVAKVIPPAEAKRYLLLTLGVKDLASLEKEWLDYARHSLKAEKGRGYFSLGRDLLNGFGDKGDRTDEAMKNLTKAIDEGGYKTAEAHLYRARAHRRLQRRDAAMADIESAIALDPTEPFLHAWRSSLFLSDGPEMPRGQKVRKTTARKDAFDPAIQAMRIACELDPYDDGYKRALEGLLEDPPILTFWR